MVGCLKKFEPKSLDCCFKEDFSLFIPRLAWFQTSKLPLRSPISSVIETGQLWCLWAAACLVGKPITNQSFVSKMKNENLIFRNMDTEKTDSKKLATRMDMINTAVPPFRR